VGVLEFPYHHFSLLSPVRGNGELSHISSVFCMFKEYFSVSKKSGE